MCEIMDEIHKYVPAKPTVDFFPLFSDEPPIPYDDESFHQVIFSANAMLF